jgi:hypothetical protein
MTLKEELDKLLKVIKHAEKINSLRVADDCLKRVLEAVIDGVYVESLGLYDFRKEISEFLKTYNTIQNS